MKHLEVRQKYSAARRIFNWIVSVSSRDETLRLMLDILHKGQWSFWLQKFKLRLISIAESQGRSQYEANWGTCLSHLRFDPSVLFKRSHHKDPK